MDNLIQSLKNKDANELVTKEDYLTAEANGYSVYTLTEILNKEFNFKNIVELDYDDLFFDKVNFSKAEWEDGDSRERGKLISNLFNTDKNAAIEFILHYNTSGDEEDTIWDYVKTKPWDEIYFIQDDEDLYVLLTNEVLLETIEED